MELVDLLQVAKEDVFLTHQLCRDDVLHGATLHLLHVALQQDKATLRGPVTSNQTKLLGWMGWGGRGGEGGGGGGSS